MGEPFNLEAALTLAAAGLPVFPVRVRFNHATERWDKQPCISGWKTRATADEALVREFWHVFPDAVPGLALGQAGLVVLDADRHGGPDGVRAFADLVASHGLPNGVVRIDTAGGGEHWVFRNLKEDPLGNREGVLPGGINIRGQGGFIVAPGTVRPDGQRWSEAAHGPALIQSYKADTIPEIPAWLVGLIRTRGDPVEAAVARNSVSAQSFGSRERTYAARALEDEFAQVSQAQPGTRNETLNKAGFALGTMAGAGWLEPDPIRTRLIQAATSCGLVRDDGLRAVHATIESGLNAGRAEPRSPLPEGSFGTIGTIGTPPQSGWAEPDLSYCGSGRTEPPPFSAELLGPFWGEWCSAHARARCVPVDYVGAALLASASALIGNARWAQATPEWHEPPILWLGIVGNPSAGKSPGSDPPLAIVRQIERQAIEAIRPEREAHDEAVQLAKAHEADWLARVKEALKKGEAPPPRLAEAIEPNPVPLPRIVVGDTTPEKLGTLLKDNPKGLLLYRDEIAGWLGNFGRYSSGGGGERAMWLEAYGGRTYTVDRQKDPEPIVIPHLSVAVLGGVQPDKLPLITGGADDGFAARFLWCWPEPIKGFRLAREPVSGTLQQEALRRLHGMSMTQADDGGAQPGRVPLSESAAHHFERYVAEAKARANNASGVLAGALGKVAGHVLRLSLLLEYLNWCEAMFRPEPGRIGETAMLSAIGLVDSYFLPMARRVLGEAAIPEEDRRATELARWILEAKPVQFNAREIRRKLGGLLREAKAMTQACETLIQAGWIRPVERPAGASGGRSPSTYEVNPAVLQHREAA